jgi:hypothetical protein
MFSRSRTGDDGGVAARAVWAVIKTVHVLGRAFILM